MAQDDPVPYQPSWTPILFPLPGVSEICKKGTVFASLKKAFHLTLEALGFLFRWYNTLWVGVSSPVAGSLCISVCLCGCATTLRGRGTPLILRQSHSLTLSFRIHLHIWSCRAPRLRRHTAIARWHSGGRLS